MTATQPVVVSMRGEELLLRAPTPVEEAAIEAAFPEPAEPEARDRCQRRRAAARLAVAADAGSDRSAEWIERAAAEMAARHSAAAIDAALAAVDVRVVPVSAEDWLEARKPAPKIRHEALARAHPCKVTDHLAKAKIDPDESRPLMVPEGGERPDIPNGEEYIAAQIARAVEAFGRDYRSRPCAPIPMKSTPRYENGLRVDLPPAPLTTARRLVPLGEVLLVDASGQWWKIDPESLGVTPTETFDCNDWIGTLRRDNQHAVIIDLSDHEFVYTRWYLFGNTGLSTYQPVTRPAAQQHHDSGGGQRIVPPTRPGQPAHWRA